MSPASDFATDFVIKRSDFGVGKPSPALGDDVIVSIGLEGTQEKVSRVYRRRNAAEPKDA